MKICLTRCFLFLITTGIYFYFGDKVLAAPEQLIQSDRTLKTPTAVHFEKSKNKIVVKGGTQRGQNLFHSFKKFSIPKHKNISFNTVPSNIKFIITRITGKSHSNINGGIELLTRSGAPSAAHFILLNPNGIKFGSGADLTGIHGSFIASTAEKIEFADKTELLVKIRPSKNILSSSKPKIFITGSKPGELRLTNVNSTNVNSKFMIFPEESLILLGGKVTLSESRLNNLTDVRVEVVSLGSNQKVELLSFAPLRLNHEQVSQLLDITLRNSSILVDSFTPIPNAGIYLLGNRIRLMDKSSLKSTTNNGASESHEIFIQANDLKIIDKSSIFSDNDSNTPGADIIINARHLLLNCGELTSTCASIQSDSLFDSGPAGKIRVRADTLKLLNGGQILSTTFSPSQNGPDTNAGIPGNIRIESKNIDIIGGFVSTEDDEWHASGIFTGNKSSQGNIDKRQGNISVKTDRMTMNDGGIISTTTFNENQAGNLLVEADQITITGNAMNPDGSLVIGTENLPNDPIGSGLYTGVEPKQSGKGGKLMVRTSKLDIRDGGKLLAATFGSGQAGQIDIKADQINLSGADANDIIPSSIFAGSGGIPGIIGGDSKATGKGNNVNINTRTLLVKDGAAIAVGSLNPNAKESQGAGNLNINSEIVIVDNAGQLISNTASGDGGNINLAGYRNTEPMQALFLLNSGQISSTAGSAKKEGNGGDIRINSESILANLDTRFNAQGNDITANAFSGNGGNIDISTDLLVGIQDRPAISGNQSNDIDASSKRGGISGTINISATLADPAQALVDLPVNTTIPKVARQCDRKIASAPSSLINSRKGGIEKISPTDTQMNQTWEDIRLAQDVVISGSANRTPNFTNQPVHAAVVEAQSMMRSPTGQLMLIAESIEELASVQVVDKPCLNAQSLIEDQ